MREFVVYTALRIGLFVATYAVIGGGWALIFGTQGVLLLPFVLAIVVSALLSVVLLRRHRQALAERVHERAARSVANFEEREARDEREATRDVD